MADTKCAAGSAMAAIRSPGSGKLFPRVDAHGDGEVTREQWAHAWDDLLGASASGDAVSERDLAVLGAVCIKALEKLGMPAFQAIFDGAFDGLIGDLLKLSKWRLLAQSGGQICGLGRAADPSRIGDILKLSKLKCRYAIGSAVRVRSGDGAYARGTVRWFGHIPGTVGEWVGVEIQDRPIGMADGSGEQRIFEFEWGCGVFCREDDLSADEKEADCMLSAEAADLPADEDPPADEEFEAADPPVDEESHCMRTTGCVSGALAGAAYTSNASAEADGLEPPGAAAPESPRSEATSSPGVWQLIQPIKRVEKVKYTPAPPQLCTEVYDLKPVSAMPPSEEEDLLARVKEPEKESRPEAFDVGVSRRKAAAKAVEEEEELGDVLPMWEPTLGEVPRPGWLPTDGPGNRNVSPEKWGMTLRQFCAFIMACFMGDEAKGGGSISKFAEKKPNKTEAKHAKFVTLYDVVDRFVKPWTSNTGNSIALLLNRAEPLQAQMMVSHAWGEDIIEAMVATLGKAFAMDLPLDTAIWFCAFAQYQPGDQPGDCGPGVAEQLAFDPFKKVIASCPEHGMVVLHTSRAELYGRLWCVYEVNEAIDCKVDTQAAVSMNYLVEYYLKRTLEERSPEELTRVDTASASCFSESDKAMIHGLIRAKLGDGGFAVLDDHIRTFRQQALERMHSAAHSFFEWADSNEVAKGNKQKTVCILRDKVRTAGIFVALHCLHAECTAAQYTDAEYHGRIAQYARMTLKPLGMHRHQDGKHPPMFDPDKASTEQLEKLLGDSIDDEHLRGCLADLGSFRLPVGYLEMSAGGRHAASRVPAT